MYPVIDVFGTRVGTWGILVALAALSVLWLGRANAAAAGLSARGVERAWPPLIFGGFAGAHLYYLVAVAGWPAHRWPAAVVLDVFSGTAIQGGILGGALAAAACLRATGEPVLPLFDALAPCGALAQALTRVGCFAAGCCYGRPTSSFLGVVYSSPFANASTPRGVPLHPAQLYEAALDCGLALVLQRRLRARRAPGELLAAYLAGSSAARFIVEFYRGDDAGRLFHGLAHSQLTALALFFAAAAAWARLRSRKEVGYDIA